MFKAPTFILVSSFSNPLLLGFYIAFENYAAVHAEVQKDPAAAFAYYADPLFAAQSIEFMLGMLQASQIARTSP
jgi:hypothetical protein